MKRALRPVNPGENTDSHTTQSIKIITYIHTVCISVYIILLKAD